MQPPFHWRYTIREVRRRPSRALLTLVGIVLGVAAVTAVHLASTATRESYTGMFAVAAGRAVLEVVPAAGEGVFTPAPQVLEGVPGVAAVAPVVRAPAALRTAEGPQPILVLGVDPAGDSVVRDYRLVEGTLFSDDGMLLEAAFARRHGCAVGRRAVLNTARGPAEVLVSGLLAAEGPARFNGGAIAFLPLKRAQSLFTGPNEVSAVQVVLDKGADPAKVREAIESRLPGRSVQAPSGRSQLAAEFLRSLDPMLGSLGGVAAVAGALVILNTFLMSLGERRRQLALLRALGATRRQVAGLLLRQALLLGGVGTLLGLPLGVALATLLLRTNENFLSLPHSRLQLTPAPLLLAALLGPAMTLVATFLPARRAARRSPLADLSLRGAAIDDRPARWPIALGLTLLVMVATFEVAILRGWLPATVATNYLPFAVTAGLVGCACVLPALLPALLRLSAWVVPVLLGVEGRLAVRQLSRHQSRAALTVSILFAAITACLAFGLSYLNNVSDIRVWFTRTIEAEYIVRAVLPDPAAIVTPAALPPATAGDVGKLPGCDVAMRFRFQPTRTNGVAALGIAREFPTEAALPLVLHEGAEEDVRAGLARGDVVLGSALASRLGVGVGGSITLPGRDGPTRLRVCGIAKEYTVGGMAFYLDWVAASRWLGIEEAHGIAVRPRPGEEEALGRALAEYCRAHGLLFQTNSDFADLVFRVADGVRGLMAGMVGLVFLVAVVGVVNTLATNVLDQTRELGVLRALGMRRREVGRLVRAQAVVLALASCVPGVPAGVLMFYLMNLAVPGLLGHRIPFHVNGWFVVACAVGVLALSVLAAAPPARRAARLAVIDAVRYE